MSLGTWFRDYLYFPLGGSRCGKGRNIFNLFVVWLLTGIWHGANFTFIVWGLMYFVLLVIEKLTGLHKKGGKRLAAVKWLYTLFFVVIGWVVFRADSLSDALRYLASMFGLSGNVFVDGVFIGWLTQNIILLCIGVVLCTPVFRIISNKTKNSSAVGYIKAVGLICLFVLSVASLVGNSYNPFIYFNF